MGWPSNIFYFIIVAFTFSHYENTPIQYNGIFYGCKNEKFQMKKCVLFVIFAQMRDFGYSSELPEVVLTGTHNLYFIAEIRKLMYTPASPIFFLYKSGV